MIVQFAGLGCVGASVTMLFVFGTARDAMPWWMTIYLVLLGVPSLRSFGVPLGESIAPVAGLGILRDSRGRRWTVADSCMLIRRNGWNDKMITVELAGPAGYWTKHYFGVDDSGFQTLWRRWMHPYPKPDLLV